MAESRIEQIKAYWNDRIHDMEMTDQPVGSKGFFDDLAAYRYEKLHYLPKMVDFNGYAGKALLEVGCGIGTDLERFAAGGAICTGVDLSETAIDLAKKNMESNGQKATLLLGNGEALDFEDNTFDVVYAHGVLQYTDDIQKMVDELYRVLKPGGQFIGMLYNKDGWLMAMSKVFKVDLEHDDAPSFNLYTAKEFRQFLKAFKDVKIVPERFPVKSKLQKGLKAVLFNTCFVGGFNLIPRLLVRRWGWHLMGFGVK